MQYGRTMNSHAIHRNLSTSFVNLGSLVLHLQERRFVGKVRIETESYEAEIIFSNSRMVYVRDCDLVTGRTRVGDQALREALKRSQEPLGLISVFEADPLLAGNKVFIDRSIYEDAKKQGACWN